MGIISNLRGSRPQDGLPVSDGLSSSSASSSAPNKKKWSNLMVLLVALVVVAEIALLGRLDVAKNTAFLDSWQDFFYKTPPVSQGVETVVGGDLVIGLSSELNKPSLESCKEALEKEDFVAYSRDFDKDPIVVYGDEQEWKTCPVGCKFASNSDNSPDAVFGISGKTAVASVLRSMESAEYYLENNIDQARRNGYTVVMTTSLSSDVPVGYFSWAEYDIMAPVHPKTEKALAAAFISNCDARNFRMQALNELGKANITIDSYGRCRRNRDGSVNKVEALKRYKFSLAFENSNEEDYVTEKFFQSLVAGSIPVVVGAPNIEDFAPSPESILHIKELSDVQLVASRMKYLAENPDAYNQSLRWKYEGPSDSFKALFDMAAVHSSCRLCIHLATLSQVEEEKSPDFKKRPCKCTSGRETLYHLYVRERGSFQMNSIFLSSGNLTLEAFESALLTNYKSRKYVPVWKQERPESIRGRDDDLKIHTIYPLGLTQRQALYTFKFQGDADFRNHIESNPCAKFEVIFV